MKWVSFGAAIGGFLAAHNSTQEAIFIATMIVVLAMVGNSASPPPLRAIAEANLDPVVQREALAA